MPGVNNKKNRNSNDALSPDLLHVLSRSPDSSALKIGRADNWPAGAAAPLNVDTMETRPRQLLKDLEQIRRYLADKVKARWGHFAVVEQVDSSLRKSFLLTPWGPYIGERDLKRHGAPRYSPATIKDFEFYGAGLANFIRTVCEQGVLNHVGFAKLSPGAAIKALLGFCPLPKA